MSIPYDPAFRRRLQSALETAKAIVAREERPGDLKDIERELTLRHAAAVKAFLARHALDPEEIDRIGFHGQTVLQGPSSADGADRRRSACSPGRPHPRRL